MVGLQHDAPIQRPHRLSRKQSTDDNPIPLPILPNPSPPHLPPLTQSDDIIRQYKLYTAEKFQQSISIDPIRLHPSPTHIDIKKAASDLETAEEYRKRDSNPHSR